MTEEERKKYYDVIVRNWTAFNQFLKNGEFSEKVLEEYATVIDEIYTGNEKTVFAKEIGFAVLNEIERLCKENKQ